MYTFSHELLNEQYDAFVQTNTYTHYMKTTSWALYKKEYENYEYFLCGLYQDKTLVASALVLSNMDKIRKKYLYIPYGMCCDYTNIELTTCFLEHLKLFAKTLKATFLRINPNVLRYKNTIDGLPLINEDNHEYVSAYFIKQGFKHRGYTYAYDGSWANRFTLAIDITLSLEELLKKFPKTTQNIHRKKARLGIEIRKGTTNEIVYLEHFATELSKTQTMTPLNTTFFKQLLESNTSILDFFICEMDLVVAINNQIDEINSDKYKKDLNAKEAAIKQLDSLNELKEKYGTKVIINTSIYAHVGDKVWNLYNYNRKDFVRFNSSDHDHIYTIAYYQNIGATFYDLVGFSGNTDKNDPYYGLYAYKSKLNAIWIENIGEFDYILRPFLFYPPHYLNKMRKIFKH